MSRRFIGINTCILIGLLSYGFQTRAEELESYRLFRSGSFLGRGDTGIAAAEGHEAIFYNPAGLAVGKGIYKETVFLSPTFIMSSDTKNLVRKMVLEEDNSVSSLREHVGKNQHIGINNFTGVVFRRASLGGFVNSQNNLLIYKSPENRAVEILEASSISNAGVTFSIAEQFFNDTLAIGTTVKYINQSYASLELNVLDSENIADQLSADNAQQKYMGTGADLGFLYTFPSAKPLKLGLVIENVGTLKLINQDSGGAARTMPQMVNLGVTKDFTTRMSQMSFHCDLRDLSSQVEDNIYKKIHLGGELSFANFFGFQSGLNQGYSSFGLFLNLYLARFDIGFYTQERGSAVGVRPDERFFLKIRLGL